MDFAAALKPQDYHEEFAEFGGEKTYMPTFKIKRWTDGVVLVDCTPETLRDAVVKAVRAGTNLTGTNLTGTNLTGADLTAAKLTAANLTEARLTGANLTAADLTRTILCDCDLNGAMFLFRGVKKIVRFVDPPEEEASGRKSDGVSG